MTAIADYLAARRTDLVDELTGWVRLRPVAGRWERLPGARPTGKD
jgi:hypothetical protein